jgi:hypothetical protein
LLLQAFYSVRWERRLMEQVTYTMLLRWFVGMTNAMPCHRRLQTPIAVANQSHRRDARPPELCAKVGDGMKG